MDNQGFEPLITHYKKKLNKILYFIFVFSGMIYDCVFLKKLSKGNTPHRIVFDRVKFLMV